MKNINPIAILTLAILASPGISSADTFIKKESGEFESDNITRIDIEGYAADIDIAGWGESRITVDIVLSVDASDEEKANEVFDNTEMVLEVDDGTLKVVLDAKKKSGWSLFGFFKKSPSASISIRLPHQMDLKADTGSGNIRAEAVTGNINLDSGSGNITGMELSGEIRADTGSGNVRLEKITGSVKGDTGSGNIKVSELNGELSADTGSGDVRAAGAISRFDADTGSGNVSISSSSVLSGTSRAATGSGDVRIELPANAAFNIAAGTGSGDIRCAFDIQDGQISKNAITGKANGGGPKLAIATGSGNIVLNASN